MRGNVLDMAVGVIIGGAFGKIVTSLVNDVLMPPVGLLVGRMNFANLFINLSSTDYATLDEAKTASAPTINYGIFLNNVLDFVIVAFVIFMVVRQINRLKSSFDKKEASAEPAAPTARECPYCFSSIPIKATRCAHCTSQL